MQYNQTVLVRQQQEFEDVKVAAVKMVQDAEERLEYTLQILAERRHSLPNWRVMSMNNRIPRTYQGLMH